MDTKKKINLFPYYKQPHEKACGPACLKMIALYHHKDFNMEQMSGISRTNKLGVSLLDISEVAKRIGFIPTAYSTRVELLENFDLPAILHWNQHHFVVLVEINNSVYHIADPARGMLKFNEEEFVINWQTKQGDQNDEGVILTLSAALNSI